MVKNEFNFIATDALYIPFTIQVMLHFHPSVQITTLCNRIVWNITCHFLLLIGLIRHDCLAFWCGLFKVKVRNLFTL